MEMRQTRFRLVVLGPGKVGKTSIIRRYLHGAFDEKYRETVEDLYSRNFNIQEIEISLEILDTNFDYPGMRKIAIASANAFMLVFAVNDVASFKQMSDIWSQIVQQRKDARTLPTVIVGNKCDSSSQKVYEATVRAWMQRSNFNISYVESSAKMNYNIMKIFRNFLDQSRLLDEEKWAKQQKLQSHEISPIKKLNRNWSLPVNKAKGSSPKALKRSGSLIRRSKHQSLRMKCHDKEIPLGESDCKIS
ncbi:Ras family protein [Loa loa]|uniref:Ras family protein n=1 Tax=Loa loa TaxID=7209 RepID=A0A1I7W368_LOALO|nr:Ras family protein [Loa loa]EFO21465.2 Ras family protein [Loa loa]